MLAEEIELVQRSLEQDTKAFGELITRYQQEMVGLILRMGIQGEDAQDLVQEIFLQAYRSLGSFRQEAKFSTWLYRIASNKCLDFLRKQKRERARIAGSCDDEDSLWKSSAVSKEGTPEEIFLRQERIRQVQSLVSSLPDKYRVALVLNHYHQMSYQEIADVLEIPLKTVSTRIYRAKLLLKEKLVGGDGL